jgi:alkylated DNA repair protein (DNA oxidative demethylase)
LTSDLFDTVAEAQPSREEIADGAVLLRGFVKPIESELIEAVRAIVAQSPFRRMTTPGGHLMSVAMTNCGERGWITDHTGYRYDPVDPRTGAPWPAMPPVLRDLARRAAEQGGFAGFAPDACLVNRYEPGTRLSLHQDKDELDYSAPIVSVSLGLPATFCSAAWRATTSRGASGSFMATSWSGAALAGSPITVWRRSLTASIRCWAGSGSI